MLHGRPTEFQVNRTGEQAGRSAEATGRLASRRRSMSARMGRPSASGAARKADCGHRHPAGAGHGRIISDMTMMDFRLGGCRLRCFVPDIGEIGFVTGASVIGTGCDLSEQPEEFGDARETAEVDGHGAMTQSQMPKT